MKKTFLLSVVAALFLGACGGSDKSASSASTAGGMMTAASETASHKAATNELNLFVWSDYVDPATVETFGKDNNINVTQAFYDSNEVLEAKILTGNSGYDLVAPSLSNVGRQIKAGAYQEIDKSQISCRALFLGN